MIDKHTTLVVYLIWVSKELLDKAYKEITIISLIYCAEYWKKLDEFEAQQAQLNGEKSKEDEEYKSNLKKMRIDFKEHFLQNLGDYYKDH